MLKRIPLLPWSVLLAISIGAFANPEPSVLLEEDFEDLGAWKDLSLAVEWGDSSTPESAFLITNGVLQLNPEINGFTGYSRASDLKTFNALDFQFPERIEHDSNILTIDFSARWESYAPSKAENNRFLLTVQYDYPSGGLDLNNPSLVSDPAGHPWARPAYQIRMRGAPDSVFDADNGGSTILQYGGGADPLGEYEYLPGFGWWAPGFNSSAFGNGTHSSGAVSPPGEYSHGGPFPFNSWINTPTGLASTRWQQFRFIIYPERMELWRDSNQDGQYQLEQTLILPETGQAPDIAHQWGYYNYFPTLEGVRLYWRVGSMNNSRDQVYIDNVSIQATNYQSHYRYWLYQFFDTKEIAPDNQDLGDLEMEEDYNKDGISNGIAYAAGFDPRQALSVADVMTFSYGMDHVEVTYPQSWYAYDADLQLEWSTDLQSWHSKEVTTIRLEDDIDAADSSADVLHRDSWYERPEVQSGKWTIKATIPRPAQGDIFLRLRTVSQ